MRPTTISRSTSRLALEAVNGSDSHDGLDPGFEPDWKAAAEDAAFGDAQDHERDRLYFNPAVAQGKSDGLGTLGQFTYYDALVMHGPGDDPSSFGGMRETAMQNAATPAQGGDEVTYLNAFLDARWAVMDEEHDHVGNVDRIDTEQRPWVKAGNLDLDLPLKWTVNNQQFEIP
jgi:chitosanase